jgi:Tfp pilus assembly protein PilF
VPSRARLASGGVGDHLTVDDVGEPPFQAAHGFHGFLASGDFAVVVGAAFAVAVAELDDGHDVQRAPAESFADLNNLGFAFWLRGNYSAARRMYQLALEGMIDPTVLNNLDMIEERLGEYTAATKHYRRALSVLLEQGNSSGRGSLQARILNNLGVSLTLDGHPAEGASSLEEALAMRRQLYSEESVEYAITLRNLGLVAEREGRLNDARRLVERARDLLARSQGLRGAE